MKIEFKVFKLLKIYGIDEKFYIDPKDIQTDYQIGRGGFGKVYRGKYLGSDIAIKEFGQKRKRDI